MLTITFSYASFDRPQLRDRYDLLLGVVANLVLGVRGRSVFTEPMFPIVELRAALSGWLDSEPRSDFEFESMESAEQGLVWFRRQPTGRWRAGSVLQDDIAADELSISELIAGAEAFIGDVDRWVRDKLQVEVEDVLAR